MQIWAQFALTIQLAASPHPTPPYAAWTPLHAIMGTTCSNTPTCRISPSKTAVRRLDALICNHRPNVLRHRKIPHFPTLAFPQICNSPSLHSLVQDEHRDVLCANVCHTTTEWSSPSRDIGRRRRMLKGVFIWYLLEMMYICEEHYQFKLYVNFSLISYY
jgi:hypothetical protein